MGAFIGMFVFSTILLRSMSKNFIQIFEMRKVKHDKIDVVPKKGH